ncbi:Uncharacterized protein TCM_019201 [Theobroma cacao]|uniref:Retrotransposon Copia-like N-terminal domain-containing protein n=1 Tax=Theobroma cacao TaxID=3641 RepID=A0A061EH24_THECC|nr:Uncharacterized protein TCM_019201 [Theobroma cacao]
MAEVSKTRVNNSTNPKSSNSHLEDLQSFYYVHHTNNHGSVVVNPKLTSTNYITWSRSFLLALSIRNKVSFIDETIPKPCMTDPLYSSWIRCNNLIVAWLLDSITPPIALTMFYMEMLQKFGVLLNRTLHSLMTLVCAIYNIL